MFPVEIGIGDLRNDRFQARGSNVHVFWSGNMFMGLVNSVKEKI